MPAIDRSRGRRNVPLICGIMAQTPPGPDILNHPLLGYGAHGNSMYISDEGKIGIGLGLLGLGGGGAIMVAPQQLWIGWMMFSLAASGGVALLIHHFCSGLRERKGFVLVLIGTGLLISGSIIGLVGAFQMDSIKEPATRDATDLTKNEGILIPANLPTPKLPQGATIPEDGVAVLYGDNVSVNTVFPHTVLQMRGEPMIVIDRDPKTKNLPVTTLRIFDDRDDIIARLDQDGFWVQNTSRKKRPDEHTLIVYDHNDQQVLKINFINPQMISIEGVFRHPRAKPNFIVVTEKQMIMLPSTIVISGNVGRNTRVMISL